MYCSLEIAKGFVRPGSGECDDAKLTEIVNKIRRQMMNWYSEVALFVDVVECYCLQRYCADTSGKGEWFNGITLGRECAAIEAMWVNSWPVTLRSSWREWQNALSPHSEHGCEHGIQKYDLPGFFSTFADLIPGQPKRVRFRCDSPQDVGKKITVRGMTPAGVRCEYQMTLSTSPMETPEMLSSIDQQGGIVKDLTVGQVTLADSDGRLLGLYSPDETVPSMKRVKITGHHQGCGSINVRSARRYYPVYCNTDVVETDNQPAWDAMARYLRSFERADKTSDDVKVENNYLASARGHVLGDRAREEGKGTKADLKIATPGIVPMRMRLSTMRQGWGREW